MYIYEYLNFYFHIQQLSKKLRANFATMPQLKHKTCTKLQLISGHQNLTYKKDGYLLQWSTKYHSACMCYNTFKDGIVINNTKNNAALFIVL